jgi:hypothetical protein
VFIFSKMLEIYLTKGEKEKKKNERKKEEREKKV